MKVCSKCGCRLYAASFSREKKRKDGRRPDCKVCVAKTWKRFYRKNKSEQVARVIGWRKINPDKKRKYDRVWSHRHPSKRRAKWRRWAKRNPEKQKSRKRRQYLKKKQLGS